MVESLGAIFGVGDTLHVCLAMVLERAKIIDDGQTLPPALVHRVGFVGLCLAEAGTHTPSITLGCKGTWSSMIRPRKPYCVYICSCALLTINGVPSKAPPQNN